MCTVPNYDTYGKITDWETTCAKSGKACPCGKNTVSCPDPNDAASAAQRVPDSGSQEVPMRK